METIGALGPQIIAAFGSAEELVRILTVFDEY
jgi:hypothetical protein